MIHSILSGRIILNIRQASSQQIFASRALSTTEDATAITFMFGDDSHWQFEEPEVASAPPGNLSSEERKTT